MSCRHCERWDHLTCPRGIDCHEGPCEDQPLRQRRPLSGRSLSQQHKAMVDAGVDPAFRVAWLNRETAKWDEAERIAGEVNTAMGGQAVTAQQIITADRLLGEGP